MQLKFWHWLQATLGCLSLSILSASIPIDWLTRPATAAEQIYITYGLLGGAISFESIEVFAREGRLEPDLNNYARYLDPEELAQLQEFLTTRAELSQVAVAQFLYTEQGEYLLQQVGTVLETASGETGFYALRAALINAAGQPEGLTPLNVLRNFPLEGLRVNIVRGLAIASELETLINNTARAIAAIETQADREAAQEPDQEFSQLADLRLPGEFSVGKREIDMSDASRGRSFETDLYLPSNRNNTPLLNAPLIVISHGLGSDRTAYSYLAEHLTSYGFAVATLDHPGSNSDQLQALLVGKANEVIEPSEFIDRPLDIKYVIDNLEQRSRSEAQLRGRIDLERVGIIGQSMGGYTALVLAGAEIDLQYLQENCAPENRFTFNISVLLQCRARELSQIPNLHDNRVKAAIAINPIGSTILSQDGFSRIRTPIMMVAGNADTIAPALPEQIYPFTWIRESFKYLLLIRGSTHFSAIGESAPSSGSFDLPPEVVGADPALARRYISAMSVAFLENYVAGQPGYDTYLSASYAKYLSEAPLPLQMVRFLTPTDLPTD